MQPSSRAKLLFVNFFMAALLSACGGGGSPLLEVRRSAILTGSQEIPAVTTTAYGTGSVVVDTDTKVMTGSLTTTPSAIGTAAHIYMGTVGIAGASIIPLDYDVGAGVWNVPATVLTQPQYDALLADELYFNVLNLSNPNGEIRGQITKPQVLTGLQEIPPVTITSATGVGTLAVSRTPIVNTYAVAGGIITNSISGTAAHIHSAPAGFEGADIIALAETAPGSGVWMTPPGAFLTQIQYDASLVSG